MDRVRTGVIGYGQMGELHARIYKRMPQVELVGICEYDDERRAQAKADLSCEGYKDYRELLADPRIEAVSIVLPDDMHREAVEAAVAAKKHILLEKPLAKELADGKAMYELLKDYEKVFTLGFLLRFDPRFAMIKEDLVKGNLGDIIYLYCRRNSPIIGPKRYIGHSNLSMHVMIHDIDYINWFMDCKPVRVFAKSRSVLLKEYHMDDVICAVVTYENGAVANLEAAWVLPEQSPTIIDDQVELIGTKGAAYVDACDKGLRFVRGGNPSDVREKIEYPDSRHWYNVNGAPAGDLAEELSAFINNIVEGTKSVITPKAALEALMVVDAIERSLREGAEVTI